MKMNKIKGIIHPYLLGLWPLFLYYQCNLVDITYLDLFVYLFASIVVIHLMLIALKLICPAKKLYQVAAILSVFLFLFFSYGQVFSVSTDWHLWGLVGRNRFLMPIYSILVILVAIFIFSLSFEHAANLNKIFNVISVLLLLFSIITIAYSKFTIYNNISKTSQSEIVFAEKTNETHMTLPVTKEDEIYQHDYYYIILDGYLRSDISKKLYHFNNDVFLDYLKQKDFYVATRSTSNYPNTHHSLASLLNMEYLDNSASLWTNQKMYYSFLRKCIRENKVMNLFRSKGYKVIHLSSGLKFADAGRQRDIAISNRNIYNSYVTFLISVTPLNFLFESLRRELLRENVQNIFTFVPQLIKIDGPKFFFIHIGIPHDPYIFGKDGEDTTQGLVRRWEDETSIDAYFNQILFANKKVTRLIDTILKNSKHPPVIILQSDHGWSFRLRENYFTDSDINKSTFSTLSAFYFPDKKYAAVYNSISSVNTFRLVLNKYFNLNYSLLEDKNYQIRKVAIFHDVTDMVIEDYLN